MGEVKDSSVTLEGARNVGQKITLISIAFFLAVLLYVLVPRFASPDSTTSALSPGKPAPGFTVSLYSGAKLSLASLQGSVAVVNFWASWCQPCRYEAAALQQVWEKYQGKGVTFVGVDVQDTPADAKVFMDEFKITYPNGPDTDNTISRVYRITGVPETYLVAKDGRLAKQFIGPVEKTDLEGALDGLIK